MQLLQETLINNADCVQVEYVGVKTTIKKMLVSRYLRGKTYGSFVNGDKLYVHKQDLELQPHLFKLVEKPTVVKKTRKRRKPKTEVVK